MGIGGSDLFLDSLSLAAMLTSTNLDIIISLNYFYFLIFLIATMFFSKQAVM